MKPMYDFTPVSGFLKTAVIKVPARTETLQRNLRWWLGFCFILGIPLGDASCGFTVKLYMALLLIANLAFNLPILIFCTTSVATATQQIMNLTVLCMTYYSCFLQTFILQLCLMWNLKKIRALFLALNEDVIFDLNLKRILQKASPLAVFYALFVQFCINMGNVAANGPIFDWSKDVRSGFWFCYSNFGLYSYVISYTIALLTFVLGYQFSLFKDAIKLHNGDSWEKLYQRHLQLCKLAGQLQECFSVTLTILFTGFLLTFCVAVFYISSMNSYTSFLLPWLILAAADVCMRCVCICSAADYLKSQAESIALQLAEVDVKQCTQYSKEVVQRLTANVRNFEYLTTFSVGGFFHLNKSLLLAMSANTLTYFLLLWQTRNDELKTYGQTNPFVTTGASSTQTDASIKFT